jgi:hypothetical protein
VSLTKRAAIGAGAVGGIAGAAWLAQRAAAARVRRTPDHGAERALDAPIYVDHTIDSHDR